jgi:hypothetical protein
MLLYLLLVWPFTTWQLQTAELVCHGSELSIFVNALALSFTGESLSESTQEALQTLMLGKQCDVGMPIMTDSDYPGCVLLACPSQCPSSPLC